jgi:hypothetical protein
LAGLQERANRRLFERLTEFGAVRDGFESQVRQLRGFAGYHAVRRQKFVSAELQCELDVAARF